MSKNYMYVSSNPIENLFHNILYHDELIFTAAKGTPDTFCGYPIEQIHSNKSGVSMGYKILEEDPSEVC